MNTIRARRKPRIPTPWTSAIPTIFRACSICAADRLEIVRKEIWGHGATNEETLQQMHNVWDRYRYITDPHTAVGMLAWEAYRKQHPEPRKDWFWPRRIPPNLRKSYRRELALLRRSPRASPNT